MLGAGSYCPMTVTRLPNLVSNKQAMPQTVALHIGSNAEPLPDTYHILDSSTLADSSGDVSVLRLRDSISGKVFGCRQVKKSRKASRQERL